MTDEFLPAMVAFIAIPLFAGLGSNHFDSQEVSTDTYQHVVSLVNNAPSHISEELRAQLAILADKDGYLTNRDAEQLELLYNRLSIENLNDTTR